MKNAAILLAVSLLLMVAGCATTGSDFRSADEEQPLDGGLTEWNAATDKEQKSLIDPPADIPCFSRMLLEQAEQEFEKELLPGRILTWSTDLGLASGYLELYVEQGAAAILDPRLVYLIRLKVSYQASCPFAIDVNAWKYRDYGITPEEISGLQGRMELDEISSFSEREIAALKYASAMTLTPVRFSGSLLEEMRKLFSVEEIVAIAVMSAKVNYWARLIEAWRIKPAGYTDDPVLDIEDFKTFLEY